MIVLIGSQKGGCGKSTIAVNLAAALAIADFDVVLVDADKQETAANWIAERAERDVTPIRCKKEYKNIRKELIKLDKLHEIVIVDVAGRDSEELRYGMSAAHVMLVPFRPSQPDLDTLGKLQEVIIGTKVHNPALKVLGLLTMAPTNPIIQEVAESKAYLNDYPEIQLLNTIIRDRKVYRDAMSEGLGVVEMGNNKAKLEIQKLVQEVFHG